MLATGGALATAPLCGPMAWAASPDDAARVKRVYVMFKCHFDAGFVNTQQHVVDRYFQEFFPKAIQVGRDARASGKNRYTWTTGSWLLYEYLEQASPAARSEAEKSIAAGDLAWHALPFSWQSELLDESLITGSLSLSRSLDARFGKTTTGAKMTDVPGHTRGLVAPLANGGVTFLDIGVNGASRPAQLPPLFRWKDSRGNSLIVMYHHQYGGVAVVPGSDVALATVVRGDNRGPHTPEEIASIYADLRSQFPNAEVHAGSLTDMANAVAPLRDKLPVVTEEIGDTWIYGVPSDPIKVARYREVARLRRNWIAQGAFQCGDATDRAFLPDFLLEVEHTWGTDTKTWLDFDHYTPDQLQSMLPTKNYQVVAYSWKEKRQDLFSAIEKLPAPLRRQATDAVKALEPHEPVLQRSAQPKVLEIQNDHLHLRLDRKTGAIERLLNKRTGTEWASAEHPLGLFSYQTLSPADYDRFFERYIISTADWARKDFGKPQMDRAGAVSRTWLPSVDEISLTHANDGQRILLAMSIKDEASTRSGIASFPAKIYTEIHVPNDRFGVNLAVSWFGKRSTRMAESIWLTFQPQTKAAAAWTMRKCAEPVAALDVVRAGGRTMHAIADDLSCASGQDTLVIRTLDAPVVALGERSPLNFSQEQPDLSQGVHFNLFNNAWGTNYVQWFGEDCRLRFELGEKA